MAGVPANLGVFAAQDPEHGRHRGVVYALAPSPLDANRIWAGTDDGLIHVTSDGGAHWRNVTPPQLGPWAKVSILEASHFDTATAYAAVNTFRLDDLRPHIYRTHDGGGTWTEIVAGIADGGIVNVVREDPERRGLLYAGTEREVYVSADDGGHWQSLRLNMPASSIRDLVVHHQDLVVGTHGRSFWILDDVTPLRQADARTLAADAALLRPVPAVRARWSTYTDTPLPPDEPAGQNPPDGAVIDYWLGRDARGPVTLEVLDASGNLVRRFSSADSVTAVVTTGNVPWYWIRPPQRITTAAGMHRFVWDLHHTDPEVAEHEYPISGVPMNTPREPRGPWALPGAYTVRLTAGGRSYTQPLTVRMDPRVRTPAADLAQQFALSAALVDALHRQSDAMRRIGALRTQLQAAHGRAAPALAAEVDSLDARIARFADGDGAAAGLERLGGELASLYANVQSADVAPTPVTATAAADRIRMLDAALARWSAVRTDVSATSARLRAAGLPPLDVGP
jgi:hypothetical protein